MNLGDIVRVLTPTLSLSIDVNLLGFKGNSILLKTSFVVVSGSLLGLLAGWVANSSRYGNVAAFGPFSMETNIDATQVGSLLKARAQPGSPRIEVVGGEEFDFGVMEPGSKGEHNFVVKNVGEYALTLEIVGSTCKCTVGKLDKSLIGPGEQTEINLTWDVKASSEDFGQSAILKTNDPTRGELNLKIKGRAISQMTMAPRSFNFGEVESGEIISLESVVYSFMADPIVPTTQKLSDASMNEFTTFSVTELDVSSVTDKVYATATQAFKVTGEIRPGLPQGAVQQNFLFGFFEKSAMGDDGKFDESKQKQFSIALTGRIVGAMSMVETSKCQPFEGGYVYTIGRVNPMVAKPERGNIMLRGKYKDSVKLSLGEVEPAGILKAELGEPVGRGPTILYPLRLWIDPEANAIERLGKSDDDYGIVWIRTDNPEVSPLRLKVRFAVAKQR